MVLVVAAVVWLVTRSGTSAPPNSGPAPTANVGSVPDAAPTSARGGRPSPLGLVPTSISIPALAVTAPVIPVGVSSGGVLGVPGNPRVIGWWSGGPRPGAAVGTAVLAGHVNYEGVAGAFEDLAALRPGAVVVVGGAAGSERFAVTGVRSYAKTGLPAAQVFTQSVAGRLVLVTCGGPFDAATGHYLDNVVVYAVAAASSSA